MLNTEASDGRKAFSAFGDSFKKHDDEKEISKNSSAVIYGFAGRQLDSESRLYYNRARMYTPALGRFLTPDPIGFNGGDINLYRYVNNDPVNFVDPSGLYPDDPAYIPGPAGTQGVDMNAYNQGVALGSASAVIIGATAVGASMLPIEFLGAGGGGRILGVKFGNKPAFHLDYFPTRAGGPYELHYHTPWAPKIHNMFDPFILPNSCENK